MKPDIAERPHHVFKLQQEGEEPVVLIHAAVCYYYIDWPVHLKESVSTKKKERGRGRETDEVRKSLY